MIPAADEIALRFGLGVVESFEQVVRGAMGQISRLVTENGSFAVKELFAWDPGDSAEDEAASTSSARLLGLTVPLEVRDLQGQLVSNIQDRRYRAYEWFDLEHHADRSPELLGNALGRLHRHASPDTRPLDPWYAVPPTPSRWEDILRAAGDAQWGPDLADLRAHLNDLAGISRRPQSRVTCHRDLVHDNVIPTVTGALAILDWENVGPLEPDQELGMVLLWCPDALPYYTEAVGSDVVVSVETYATGICIWLNFLAVQAEAALQPNLDASGLRFAERAVHWALSSPLQVPMAD